MNVKENPFLGLWDVIQIFLDKKLIWYYFWATKWTSNIVQLCAKKHLPTNYIPEH